MKTLKELTKTQRGCARLFFKALDKGMHEMKRCKIWLLFLIVLIFVPAYAVGQNVTISGAVTDAADGSPLPGVNVMVKNQNIGTITDFEGKYTIEVSSEDILVFSFVGYLPEETKVGQKSVIDIQLISDVTQMDEVVIIGYGSKKKETVVGSITQTDGEELLKAGGVTNVGEALQGKLAGVTTITGSAIPGETELKIYIRGQS